MPTKLTQTEKELDHALVELERAQNDLRRAKQRVQSAKLRVDELMDKNHDEKMSTKGWVIV